MLKALLSSLRPQTIAPYALLCVMIWGLVGNAGAQFGTALTNEVGSRPALVHGRAG